MLKFIILLMVLLSVDHAFSQGDAPAILRGQNQTQKSVGATIVAPALSVTKVSASTALIETGNNNILENPGFENATYDTAWTVVNGTTSVETTNYFSGLKAMKITASSGPVEVIASSPVNSVALADGVQMIATIMAKNTMANIQLCSRIGTTTSTTNCVSLLADNTWRLYKLPFISGAVRNGFAIKSTANTTGTLIIDNAYVGAVDVKNDQYYDTTCDTIACQTDFSAYITNGNVISTSNVNFISSCSGTSDRTCSFVAGVFAATPVCTVTDLSPTATTAGAGNRLSPHVMSISSSSVRIITVDEADTAFYNPNIFISCSKQGTDYTAAIAARKAFQKSKVTTYSQPYYAVDRIGEVIFTTNATAPAGFISALGSSIGQAGSGATFASESFYPLYAHLWSLAGLSTTAGDPYRISSAKGASALADWQANKTITIDYATNGVFLRAKQSGRNEGSYQSSAVGNHQHISGTRRIWDAAAGPYGNTTDVSVDFPLARYNGNTSSRMDYTSDPITGNATETRPNNVALYAYVRYQADNQVAVLNISGLESCTDTYQCTDTFSARVDANGIPQSENLDWINGNCSYVSTAWTCNFRSSLFTTQPSCSITPISGASATGGIVTTVSSASVSFVTTNTAGTGVQSAFNISCQKQGADYIGKTAKAVASDQNVRSVGSVGVDIQSVYFGSGTNCASDCTSGTCTICNQVGGKITSVTWSSTGQYNLNGIDGTKYNCLGSSDSASQYQTLTHIRATSNSSFARIVAAAAGTSLNTRSASVTCIGIP